MTSNTTHSRTSTRGRPRRRNRSPSRTPSFSRSPSPSPTAPAPDPALPPRPPRIYNPRGRPGTPAHAPYRMFALLLTPDLLDDLAVRYRIRGRRGELRDRRVWLQIWQRLPMRPGVSMRYARVDGLGWTRCITLADNRTRWDMQRADDVELINYYRERLGTDAMPGWYREFH